MVLNLEYITYFTKFFKGILTRSQQDEPTFPRSLPSKLYPQYPLTFLQPILNPIPANLTSLQGPKSL